MLTRARVGLALALAATTLTACGSDEVTTNGAPDSGGCTVDTSYNPPFDPAKMVDGVDSPLFPLPPGMKLTYEAGEETVEIEVLNERKMIQGVSCTVVHDVAKVSGEVIEDTFDWYAQDQSGAVWYMGEDTKEYSGGVVTSTKGSWETGVKGAKPGYIIPPNPTIGQKYRQEYYACEAEDYGEVLAINENVTVPAGSFSACLKTRDTTPLEPAANEEKYYCPGIGIALTVDVKTQEQERLIEILQP